MLMTTVAIFLLDHYLIFCSFKINIVYIIIRHIVKLFQFKFRTSCYIINFTSCFIYTTFSTFERIIVSFFE